MEKLLRRQLPGGRFRNVSPARSKIMSAIRGRGNRTTEVRLRLALVRAGLRGWTMHPEAIPGKPDFFFGGCKIAVFVDGCFWHACPKCGHVPKTNSSFWKKKMARNKRRDLRTNQALKSMGFRTLRFWEHELENDAVNTVAKIATVVREKHQR